MSLFSCALLICCLRSVRMQRTKWNTAFTLNVVSSESNQLIDWNWARDSMQTVIRDIEHFSTSEQFSKSFKLVLNYLIIEWMVWFNSIRFNSVCRSFGGFAWVNWKEKKHSHRMTIAFVWAQCRNSKCCNDIVVKPNMRVAWNIAKYKHLSQWDKTKNIRFLWSRLSEIIVISSTESPVSWSGNSSMWIFCEILSTKELIAIVQHKYEHKHRNKAIFNQTNGKISNELVSDPPVLMSFSNNNLLYRIIITNDGNSGYHCILCV